MRNLIQHAVCVQVCLVPIRFKMLKQFFSSKSFSHHKTNAKIETAKRLQYQSMPSARFASFSKKWAFTLVPPSCMTIREKNTFKSVYKRCDLHHLLPTLTTDILHSGSSATHFECQLLFRVVFVCAMNNGGSKRRVSYIFVHCLSLLPNKFIFFYLLKIIFKLQLMAISRHQLIEVQIGHVLETLSVKMLFK